MGAPSLSRSQLESSTPVPTRQKKGIIFPSAVGLTGLCCVCVSDIVCEFRKMILTAWRNYDPSPGRYLLMICAVSVALVMLEWIRTSYFRPSDASR